jgi:HSP20 family protein
LPGFNDIFESVLGDTFFSDRRLSSVPSVNISETNEAYQIELAAPGLKKEDFKVSIERDTLSISTEKSQETVQEERTYNRKEFSYASFTRMFTLPDSADVDRIGANYSEGILRLVLSKKRRGESSRKTDHDPIT